MQNFNLNLQNSKKYLVVAHDAGAANQIFATLNHFGLIGKENMFFSLYGPAKKIFLSAYPGHPIVEWKDIILHSDIDVLITGTGWATTIEHGARKEALVRGIFSIAFVDHWVNYRERFCFDSEECFPDQVIVTDSNAYKIAIQDLPTNIDIQQSPSYYVKEKVDEIHNLQIQDPNIDFLYLLEPMRTSWNESVKSGEFQALDFFLENVKVLTEKEFPLIALRPHPSDEPGKYDSWIEEKNNDNIFIDETSSLELLIAKSKIVLGCQSYALYLAHMAGKKAVSTLPPNTENLPLPFQKIICLSELI